MFFTLPLGHKRTSEALREVRTRWSRQAGTWSFECPVWKQIKRPKSCSFQVGSDLYRRCSWSFSKFESFNPPWFLCWLLIVVCCYSPTRCRLVELRVRRKSQEEDHLRLEGHLQLCAEPSFTLVSLVKKVTQGRLSEIPDMAAQGLVQRLDQAAARKLRDVVEKRAIADDLQAVLGQIKQVGRCPWTFPWHLIFPLPFFSETLLSWAFTRVLRRKQQHWPLIYSSSVSTFAKKSPCVSRFWMSPSIPVPPFWRPVGPTSITMAWQPAIAARWWTPTWPGDCWMPTPLRSSAWNPSSKNVAWSGRRRYPGRHGMARYRCFFSRCWHN